MFLVNILKKNRKIGGFRIVARVQEEKFLPDAGGIFIVQEIRSIYVKNMTNLGGFS